MTSIYDPCLSGGGFGLRSPDVWVPNGGEFQYPFHDRTITVTQCGRICFGRYKTNLSTIFAGQNIGTKQVADKIWLVTFMEYDLGYFDHQTGTLSSANNPFAPKVLPMSPPV